MTILEEAHHSLITPEIDPFLEDLTKNADRAFYFEEGPRAAPRMVSKAASVNAKVPDNSGGLLMMEARAQIR